MLATPKEEKTLKERIANYVKKDKRLSVPTAEFMSQIDIEIENLSAALDAKKKSNESAKAEISDMQKKIEEYAKAKKSKAFKERHLDKYKEQLENLLQRTNAPTDEEKIERAIKEKKAFLVEREISAEKIKKITDELTNRLPKKTEKEGKELAAEIDTAYISSIFAAYEHDKSNEDMLNEQNFLLGIQFAQQETLPFDGISIQNKDTKFTHLHIKSADNTNTNDTELGVLKEKSTLTLNAKNLAAMKDQTVKDSFYTAAFLNAMHITECHHDGKGKLELKKSILSVASLPTNPTLKQEVIEQLDKFRKEHPNVDILYDALSKEDKANLKALLDAQKADDNIMGFSRPAVAPVAAATAAEVPAARPAAAVPAARPAAAVPAAEVPAARPAAEVPVVAPTAPPAPPAPPSKPRTPIKLATNVITQSINAETLAYAETKLKKTTPATPINSKTIDLELKAAVDKRKEPKVPEASLKGGATPPPSSSTNPSTPPPAPATPSTPPPAPATPSTSKPQTNPAPPETLPVTGPVKITLVTGHGSDKKPGSENNSVTVLDFKKMNDDTTTLGKLINTLETDKDFLADLLNEKKKKTKGTPPNVKKLDELVDKLRQKLTNAEKLRDITPKPGATYQVNQKISELPKVIADLEKMQTEVAEIKALFKIDNESSATASPGTTSLSVPAAGLFTNPTASLNNASPPQPSPEKPTQFQRGGTIFYDAALTPTQTSKLVTEEYSEETLVDPRKNSSPGP